MYKKGTKLLIALLRVQLRVQQEYIVKSSRSELRYRSLELVSWSSWLWHLLNTQNVPSSILGEINFLKFFYPCELLLSLVFCPKYRIPEMHRNPCIYLWREGGSSQHLSSNFEMRHPS